MLRTTVFHTPVLSLNHGTGPICGVMGCGLSLHSWPPVLWVSASHQWKVRFYALSMTCASELGNRPGSSSFLCQQCFKPWTPPRFGRCSFNLVIIRLRLLSKSQPGSKRFVFTPCWEDWRFSSHPDYRGLWILCLCLFLKFLLPEAPVYSIIVCLGNCREDCDFFCFKIRARFCIISVVIMTLGFDRLWFYLCFYNCIFENHFYAYCVWTPLYLCKCSENHFIPHDR